MSNRDHFEDGPADPAREYVEPAFPCSNNVDYEGLDLRDYFAAKVLQAIISNPGTVEVDHDQCKHLVNQSYMIAEMMLERRRT